MKRFIALGALAMLFVSPPVFAKSILFVGNSFTYGEFSTVKTYKVNSVADTRRSVRSSTTNGTRSSCKATARSTRIIPAIPAFS